MNQSEDGHETVSQQLTVLRSDHDLEEIRLPSTMLFKTGEHQLKSGAYVNIVDLADTIQRRDESRVEVTGHTDNRSVKAGGYASNWELSGLRAANVVG